ncbi:pyrimidine utilization transport protein G [Acetobacter musti]|uniref:Pyrimidine utilization transport protein G n=2 Tax=Acetobacter musti TaxID=864732 RepID=A0ABX0JQ46_9PROT|nr:pyrimidine utilization transport protein G [Acetobacter musti]
MLRWTKVTGDQIVLPRQRLSWPRTALLGIQHVITMTGATVLVPRLMGFDPNVAVLFSGVGTLLFFILMNGRVPSYLGSSFSFIAVVNAATGYAGHGANSQIALACGGILVCAILYGAIGLAIMATGPAWIERLMPPPVTGAIGCSIGLSLAPSALQSLQTDTVSLISGLVTAGTLMVLTVTAPPAIRQTSLLIAAFCGSVTYVLGANWLHAAPPVDFSIFRHAPLFGMPHFVTPHFDPRAISMIAPVAIILVAENLGHIKALSVLTGQPLDRLSGRIFAADAAATLVAASAGGTGVTTYIENIGVMAMSGVFSTAIFPVAGLFAILLGFSPLFGAVVTSIPVPVLGGLMIVVLGLIFASMIRLWTDKAVDFSDPVNMLTVGVTVIIAAANPTLFVWGMPVGGIFLASLAAILTFSLLRRLQKRSHRATADTPPDLTLPPSPEATLSIHGSSPCNTRQVRQPGPATATPRS